MQQFPDLPSGVSHEPEVATTARRELQFVNASTRTDTLSMLLSEICLHCTQRWKPSFFKRHLEAFSRSTLRPRRLSVWAAGHMPWCSPAAILIHARSGSSTVFIRKDGQTKICRSMFDSCSVAMCEEQERHASMHVATWLASRANLFCIFCLNRSGQP